MKFLIALSLMCVSVVCIALPSVHSRSAVVFDVESKTPIYQKQSQDTKSIASITKLMTAIIVLESGSDLAQIITITNQDIDNLKHTSSRLPIGSKFTRKQLLHLALMSSENRAASALARNHPGGYVQFIKAMNDKAMRLGMYNTQFYDSTGLTPFNLSTASDLVKLVLESNKFPLITHFTTISSHQLTVKQSNLLYLNSNPLIRTKAMDIQVSKTGFINEAGRCLVMLTTVKNKPTVMIFLDSTHKNNPQEDAKTIKRWIEKT